MVATEISINNYDRCISGKNDDKFHSQQSEKVVHLNW